LKSFGKGYSVYAYIDEEAAMSVKLKDVENQVAQLTEDDRIRLVEQLIRSLDSGEDVDAEEAWLNEAERRYQDYRAGKLASRSADAVFEDALSNLK
jgi:putative addiction module component (TIGR02574 family)